MKHSGCQFFPIAWQYWPLIFWKHTAHVGSTASSDVFAVEFKAFACTGTPRACGGGFAFGGFAFGGSNEGFGELFTGEDFIGVCCLGGAGDTNFLAAGSLASLISPSWELKLDTLGGDDGELTAGFLTGAVATGLLYKGDVDDAEGFEENDGVTVWE